MRKRIVVNVSAADHARLEAVVANRNSPAINRFLAETNADPKPLVWTAYLDRVIAAVQHGMQALESRRRDCGLFCPCAGS
jgi:hypothetical protein